jgi:hypothetical protein
MSAAATASVQTGTITVPPNPGTLYPNAMPFGQYRPVRYQQVYASSLFSGLPTGGALITALSFERSSTATSPSRTFPDIQFDLSTTAAGEDHLSTSNLTDNVGIDDTAVIDRGSLTLGTNPTLTLQVPFWYNPANGNLLLDVLDYGGALPDVPRSFVLDAVNASGDGVSRVWSFASDMAAATGFDTYGLITTFTFSSVPEPSVGALLVVGALGSIGVALRRRK